MTGGWLEETDVLSSEWLLELRCVLLAEGDVAGGFVGVLEEDSGVVVGAVSLLGILCNQQQ